MMAGDYNTKVWRGDMIFFTTPHAEIPNSWHTFLYPLLSLNFLLWIFLRREFCSSIVLELRAIPGPLSPVFPV